MAGAIDKARAGVAPRVDSKPVDVARPGVPAPAPSVPTPASNFEGAQKKKVNFTGANRAYQPVVKANPELAAAVAKGRATGGAAPAAEPTAYGKSHAFGHRSAAGKISKAEWDNPTQLVGKLTQYPATGKTKQSEAACSAANLIGAALLSGGSAAAGKLLDKVSAGPNKLNPAEQAELKGIAQKVKDHTATFADLNKAQELVYRSANTTLGVRDLRDQALQSGKLSKGEQKQLFDKLSHYLAASVMGKDPDEATAINKLLSKGLGTPVDFTTASDGMLDVSDTRRTTDTSGLTDPELQALGASAVGGSEESVGKDPSIEALAKTLEPGQALTMRLSSKEDGVADHYVTLGRREDGKLYLYNPDPGPGDATLVLGKNGVDPEFLKATARYDDRFKADGDSLPPALKYSPPK